MTDSVPGFALALRIYWPEKKPWMAPGRHRRSCAWIEVRAALARKT